MKTTLHCQTQSRHFPFLFPI